MYSASNFCMREVTPSRGSDGRGSDGADGSGDRLATRVAEIDIDTVAERVTSAQSAARSAPFENRAAGVSKPKRFRPRGSNGGGAKRSGAEQRAAKGGSGQGGAG